MADYNWKKGLNQTQLDGISKISGLNKILNSMQKEINEGRRRRQMETDSRIDTGFFEQQRMLTDRLEEARKQMRDFTGEGYGLTDGSAPIMQGLTKAIEITDTFLGSSKEGAVAMSRLASNMPTGQFEAFASVLQETTGNVAANAATLAKLGLSYSSFSKNLDMATYSFNLSANEVKGFNQELFNFAKSVKQLPSVVSNNFQLVASSLAYSFPKIQQEFVKIQEMSAKTGISVNKLMGTFGQQTDTISGASSFAAGLNTILGRNAFSATQILMMSESERMEATRAALKDSQIYRDYMSGDEKLKKFALRAIAGRLQMGTDETRRFLDGEAGDSSMKGQMAAEVDSNFKAFSGQSAKFSKGLADLTESIVANTNLIDRRRRTELERDKAFMRRDLLLSISGQDAGTRNILRSQSQKQFITGYATQFGGDIATDGGGTFNVQNFAAKMFEVASGPDSDQELFMLMDRALKLRLADPLFDEKFPDPKDFIGSTGRLDRSRYKAALKDFEKDAMPGIRAIDDARISPEQMTVIQKRAQGDVFTEARLMREFRMGNIDSEKDIKGEGKEIKIKRGGKFVPIMDTTAQNFSPLLQQPSVSVNPGQAGQMATFVFNVQGFEMFRAMARFVSDEQTGGT